MASANVNREAQVRAREQVLEKIVNISPKDRPFMAAMGTPIVAENTTVEWEQDTLPVRSTSNAEVGGFTVTFAAGDWRVRTDVLNYTQLFMTKVAVDTQ